MKLKTKLFLVTDSKGNPIDLEEANTIIVLNGQPTEIKLRHIFSSLEYEEGEIYGNTLLSYYNIIDGKLLVEGSEVQFMMADTKDPVLISAIERPSVNDDEVIPFDKVANFSELFLIAKPDEVFTDLTQDEKQFFVDGRKVKQKQEDIRKGEEQKLKEKADQEKAALAEESRKKAEEELKASIKPEYIQENKDYITTQRFFAGIGVEEYITGPYHLFYGPDRDQEPSLLIKRGDTWWEECLELDITEETVKTVTIKFNDGKTPKQLTLNIEKKEITVGDS